MEIEWMKAGFTNSRNFGKRNKILEPIFRSTCRQRKHPGKIILAQNQKFYQWMKEVKDFDQSKMSVKDLVDSGLTSIPPIFVHPPQHVSNLKPSVPNVEIPIIDLSGLYSNDRRPKLVDEINNTLRTWGFFQVINHGIPMQVMDKTINAFRSFHEQPKKDYVWRDDEHVAFYSNFNIYCSKSVNWKDSLQVISAPNAPNLERVPLVCREEVVTWDECAKGLAKKLMELICEGLGVESNRLKKLTCLGFRKLVAHYYPYCPQPDLTMGLPAHTDRGVLTVLLQNDISGLQVKYGEDWVDVKPIRGGIIINVGDILQIFSNGAYKSVEHRVLANPCKSPRISVPVTLSPSKRGDTDYYGPFPELLSSTNPALYRNFTITEILKQGQTNDSGSRAILELFEIK